MMLDENAPSKLSLHVDPKKNKIKTSKYKYWVFLTWEKWICRKSWLLLSDDLSPSMILLKTENGDRNVVLLVEEKRLFWCLSFLCFVAGNTNLALEGWCHLSRHKFLMSSFCAICFRSITFVVFPIFSAKLLNQTDWLTSFYADWHLFPFLPT